ncbi:hypothetical protein ACTXT7_001466 [Hymenolepis weldensis]
MTGCVLYAGDLHPLTTLDEVAKVFSGFRGQLIRVNRSKGGSCYALLRFPTKDDLEFALNNLQNVQIGDRPVRLMRFQSDPRLRTIKGANLFVSNIDRSNFGEVLSCKIAVDNMQKSCGYGYVQFSSPKFAQQVIEACGSLEIGNKKLIVKPFKPRNERYPNTKVLPFTNCYIKNFDGSTTEADLRELFSEFGEIGSIFIPMYPNKVLKGYAFVCFKRFDEAMRAVQNLNGKEFRGRRLYVSRAEKKMDRMKALSAYYRTLSETTVYVKNLDENVNEYALQTFFSQCGKVINAKVIRDANGKSKGFGFIWFQSPNDVKTALEMQSRNLGPKTILLTRALMPVVVTSRYESED